MPPRGFPSAKNPVSSSRYMCTLSQRRWIIPLITDHYSWGLALRIFDQMGVNVPIWDNPTGLSKFNTSLKRDFPGQVLAGASGGSRTLDVHAEWKMPSPVRDPLQPVRVRSFGRGRRWQKGTEEGPVAKEEDLLTAREVNRAVFYVFISKIGAGSFIQPNI
ncbi:hypothetical protein BDN72DRAFT_864173 [Pluteus cervinus]|uniref:Uncharacterized protein n=1 Tax=Pluteus cervinus TaxID=181527 RepID=A0ACD3A5J9_9AGAR|nr:hypothetical protein BDN72DRAFT_864173 [Pluteus cervinus]